MNGGVSSKELNESSLNILGQPENDSNIQNITSLSGAEADPNIQNQAGKTLSYCLDLDKELSDILDQLARDINLLDHPNNIPYIISLLQAGADRDTQNRYGKTLSYYLDKRLSDILESNRAPLNNIQHIVLLLEAGANPNVQNREDGKTLLHYVAECNDTGGIRFLLEVIKANPNVRDQSGKTPLHYAAKNNCLQARELLLGAGANPNVQDQSGKTPSEYATEDECRQAIEDSSHSSDDSHENKGNPATPDSSVGERNDCSNSSGDDSQAKPAELSDCNAEKDQGYGSDGSCENEENPAKSPNNENWTPTDQQTSSESLEVSNSSESEDSEDSSDCDNRDNNISRLNNLAYESIVNKNNKQIHEYDFKAKINDGHFCIEYPQNNIIEPVKILNNEKAKELKLKVGTLKIGESIVRVESIDGKRNYTDILGSIEMSFTTEAGEISIYLHPSEKDSNKIEVEIDKESEARLNKLKAEKKSLGENCLLGEKSVLEAIEDKGFEKNGSVSTESTKTTKDDPSTDLTQARLQQEKKSKGK